MSDPPSRHQQALHQLRSQNTSIREDSRQGLDQRFAQTEEEIYKARGQPSPFLYL